jgi:hypothetical protein
MKTLLLILMCCLGIVLNNYAQYPIPSYNIPVQLKAIFLEKRITNPEKDSQKSKRRIVIQSTHLKSNLQPCTATVWVFSEDGRTTFGPFELPENSTLYVDIDEREWGVLVECDCEMIISVWIEGSKSKLNTTMEQSVQPAWFEDPLVNYSNIIRALNSMGYLQNKELI